ncbi:hypothetical protein HRG_008030 [Hirsutella rhossiliensis]|uniref:DUF1168-domain-containing protein n=1 Tax=Hirsutella rhossiliensis TaxID=111463 RepID=A0A9P8MTN3_9HYPO|nr:uncharacterized protein HRG_08030 [Hirsutella rhossiliensis]KAH0960877.1 hypothetical protein HRG_08030 [Hirsutella rhossiliensis]
MSGEGPDSIPTSADPRSHRPTKKRALSPASAQAASVDALFAKPDREIRLPPSASSDLARPRRPGPPEIITNVQGSSAGAGSGEFHVYKASRRREYERLRDMDADLRRQKHREQFDSERTQRERRDEEKTRKNREKRERIKARKAKAKTDPVPNHPATPAPAASTEAATAEKPRAQVITRDDADNDDQPSTPAAQAPGLVIHDDD